MIFSKNNALFIKLISTLITISCLLFTSYSCVNAQTNSSIKVVIDGKGLLLDTNPESKDSRTMVPMRGIFEALGASVTWSNEEQKITGVKGNTTIILYVNNNTAYINGNPNTMDVAPYISNGRTLVPTRFIAESLDAVVQWDAANRKVLITSAEGTKQSQRKTLETVEIARIAEPASVYIETFDKDGEILGNGSGFVIHRDGKIATNYHVIDGAYSAKIYFDNGNIYNVNHILFYDDIRDIALLKISETNLPFLKLGDSDDIANGERVVAIGSPMGLENTISEGIISSKRRYIKELNQSFIQTSASISWGSSGGALLNAYGEVIGITTLSNIYGQNLNFAIPINDIKPFLNENMAITLQSLQAGKTLFVPTGVWALGVSKNQILLGWDKVQNAQHYHVYSSTSMLGPFYPLVDNNNNKKKYQWFPSYCAEIFDITPDTTVFFKVTAVVNGVESNYSDITASTTFMNEVSLFEVEPNNSWDLADYYPTGFEKGILMSGYLSPDDFDCYYFYMPFNGTVNFMLTAEGALKRTLLLGIEDEDDILEILTPNSQGYLSFSIYLEHGIYYIGVTSIDKSATGSYSFQIFLDKNNASF